MTRRKRRRKRNFTFVSNDSGFQQGRVSEGGSALKHLQSMPGRWLGTWSQPPEPTLKTYRLTCEIPPLGKAKIYWLVNLAYLGSSKPVSYSVTNKQNRNKGRWWYLTTVLGLSCSLCTHVYTHSFQDSPSPESVDVHPQWLCVQALLLHCSSWHTVLSCPASSTVLGFGKRDGWGWFVLQGGREMCGLVRKLGKVWMLWFLCVVFKNCCCGPFLTNLESTHTSCQLVS